MTMFLLHRCLPINFYLKSINWFVYEGNIAIKNVKSKNIALKKWQLKVKCKSFGAVFPTDNILAIFFKIVQQSACPANGQTSIS